LLVRSDFVVQNDRWSTQRSASLVNPGLVRDLDSVEIRDRLEQTLDDREHVSETRMFRFEPLLIFEKAIMLLDRPASTAVAICCRQAIPARALPE